jgi:hypothetical protein
VLLILLLPALRARTQGVAVQACHVDAAQVVLPVDGGCVDAESAAVFALEAAGQRLQRSLRKT